jgi:hypothetical protein
MFARPPQLFEKTVKGLGTPSDSRFDWFIRVGHRLRGGAHWLSAEQFTGGPTFGASIFTAVVLYRVPR